MRYVLSGLIALAAVTCIAASSTMNWFFLSSLGKSMVEGYIFGAVSVSADVIKAVLPIFIVLAWVHRRIVYVVGGSMICAILVVLSLLSAVGFSASNRGAVAGGIESLNAQLRLAETRLLTVNKELEALKNPRPLPAIEADIRALKHNSRWTGTKQCTDATASRSRTFCANYEQLRAELAVNIERSRNMLTVNNVAEEIKTLRARGAGQNADHQANVLKRLVSHVWPATDVGQVQMGLIVFVAIVVEILATFGLYLATGHSFERQPRASSVKKVEVVPEVLEPVVLTTQSEQRRPRKLVISENGALQVAC